VTSVALALARSPRNLDVVVRSAVATSLESASVIVLAGTRSIRSLGDLVRAQTAGIQLRPAHAVAGSEVPQPVADQLQPGDLVAHIEHARLGDVTVCALGLGGDLLDPTFLRRMRSHFAELAVKCEHLGPSRAVAVLAVPPQQRFD
jgi:hypothetical protein